MVKLIPYPPLVIVEQQLRIQKNKKWTRLFLLGLTHLLGANDYASAIATVSVSTVSASTAVSVSTVYMDTVCTSTTGSSRTR